MGHPVDEKSRRSAPASARGGDTNGPASVYSITKYLEWLKKYAPPEAQGMTFSEAGPVPARVRSPSRSSGTPPSPPTVKEGLPVVNADGTPKWRMAPSPHGVYWKEGMKLGYQDAGSWTILKSTPDDRAKAAWLYAQFVTSKTVDGKKSHVGLTFIRSRRIDLQQLHRPRAEARRPDRVLPLAGPRAVVADRHQRS
jgi:glycerol transport system substrate-binding protein